MTDLTASEYFNRLPEFVKESIKQSGLTFNNEDELRRFVANIGAKPGGGA